MLVLYTYSRFVTSKSAQPLLEGQQPTVDFIHFEHAVRICVKRECSTNTHTQYGNEFRVQSEMKSTTVVPMCGGGFNVVHF